MYDQFLLIGDSITQGSTDQSRGFAFAAALQHAYIRRLDVINRGFSGYNSAQTLHILPSIVPSPAAHKIHFLTIFLGANDACIAGSRTRQHVPLTQYAENLHSMLNHPSILAHSSAKIILITPPPVDEHQLVIINEGKLTRNAAHTKTYADACRAVGAAQSGRNVRVLDFWTAMMTRAGWKSDAEILPGSKDLVQSEVLKEALYDGLHMNPLGYQVLFDELMALIEREWPEDMPVKLEMEFPKWEDAPGLCDGPLSS